MPLRLLRHHRLIALAAAGAALALVPTVSLGAQTGETAADPAAPVPARRLFIREYRVTGVKQLPRAEVERAVYPFLGPARTIADVNQARTALEAAYRAHGYQTVAVLVPADQSEALVRAGIIQLQVQEAAVGRLRVTGARFSSPKAITAAAPSLAEGRVPDFRDLPRDYLALNQIPGRKIDPDFRAGAAPGTVDVDLKVTERLPLTANAELNNRYSADTSKLRLNVSVGANNLWQAGHSLSLSYQTSPQVPGEVQVYSGSYVLPVPGWTGTSLMLQGTKQNSDVSTLGNVAVTGKGTTLGLRVIQALPAPDHTDEGDKPAAGEAAPAVQFYHSLSYGLDYKRSNQRLELPASDPTGEGDAAKPTILYTPITQYPLSATYSATWRGQRFTTEVNTGATLHLRGTGSSDAEFNESRYLADGAYVYFRSDLTETVRLPWDFQVQGKLQGQIADRPLLSAEQASGGGLGTVRGYLEAEVSGDNAAFASLELRSPSLIATRWGEWRFHAFGDWGWLSMNDPLPDEVAARRLLGIGAGTRLTIGRYFTGSLDFGLPLRDGPRTKAHDFNLTFRAGVAY